MALSHIAFTGLYLLCFVLAVTVCGLYGMDLHSNGLHVESYARSKWIYAVVIGSLSAVTCILYAAPLVLRAASLLAAVWNFILFLLWITLFGIFGKIYIHEREFSERGSRAHIYSRNDDIDDDIERMKNAVWVDMAGALLWFLAAIAAFLYWLKHRKTKSAMDGHISF